MPLKIPQSAGEITAAWMTEALEPNFPGAVVTSLVQGTIIHGTATKVRLLLEYNEAGHRHGLPATLWFKGGLEAHSQTDDMLIVYASEAAFYRDMSRELSNTLPRAYAAVIDEVSKQSFVLLEDLLARNATFGHATRPVGPDEVSGLITELAKLHGRFWRAPDLARFKWLGQGGSLLQSCEILMSPATWERTIALPRGQFVRGPFRDFALLRRMILHAMRSDVERANCLVHGDSHIGNTYRTGDGAMGFLDWQSPFFGMWAHDVAYLIITSLSIDDRRRHERDLLARYMAVASEQGIELSWDEAWLEYRRHTPYACSWSMCLPEWQTEETCCAVTDRAITAALDLDTLGAW